MSADSKFREQVTITWRIENYFFRYFSLASDLQTPEFTVKSLPGSRLFLVLERRVGFGELSCNCFLSGTNELDGEIVSNEKIDLITGNGEILELKKDNRANIFLLPADKITDLLQKTERGEEDNLIIRYYFTGGETRETTATRYEVKTRIGVHRCSFQCDASNFNSKGWTESQTFHFQKTSTIEMTLTASRDAVLIDIRKTEKNPTVSRRLATCKVSLLDVEGVERQSEKYINFFDAIANIETCVFPSFITKTLLNSAGSTSLKNGTFMCEFYISNGTEDSEIHKTSDISSSVNVFPTTDTFSFLEEDLRNMFRSKKHSDVKLKVGGDIFPAHKSLLTARSPVFSTMFDQGMLESRTGIVDIPDMDAETLNSFLSFVYTGTVDKMDCEVTLKLLLAADKYQVESLKEKCASFLTSNLSDGNACEVLVIADMVRHQLLKESVQDYIKARAGKILPSPEWSQWVEKNIRLASEIFSKLSLHFGSLANEEPIQLGCDIASVLNVVSPMDVFSSLKEDLRNLFANKKHSDVKLQVGGDIYPAHKSFLTARSPVFSTMFDQDMLENQTGIVDIRDMDAETLNSFLSFVYTGTVDKMDCEVTLKLLLAADKYQVESLKEKCASFLKSNLSDENACEVLVIADMVGHKLLKEHVQDYIKTHAKKILPSPEWSQWIEKNVRLASEILSKLSLQLGR